MKTSKLLALGLLVISLTPVWGQGIQPIDPTTGLPVVTNALTTFNLDFGGGTPGQLVAAIGEATGKPLNAIIPDELANKQLPALRMKEVTVPQLFQALLAANTKQIRVDSADHRSYSYFNTQCGFRTDGRYSDSSIWRFFEDKPSVPPTVPEVKACRFYELSPYLDRGYSVDDITTAVRTGWDMQGDADGLRPKISFHKETKLLIAVGEPARLEVIDAVLKALATPKTAPAIDPATGLPVNAAKSTADK